MNYTAIIQKFLNGIVDGGSYRSIEKSSKGVNERSRIVTIDRKINKEQGLAEIRVYEDQSAPEPPPENPNMVEIPVAQQFCRPIEFCWVIAYNFMYNPHSAGLPSCGLTWFDPSALIGMKKLSQQFQAAGVNFGMVSLNYNKLPTANINLILREVDSWQTSGGALLLDGDENGAPSGNGIVAKDALIARGWMVTTN